MKKLYTTLFILVTFASVCSLSSCQRFRCKRGSGNQVTENRKLSDFNSVDISGGFKVTVVQDSSQTIAVHADDNLMKYIETSVTGGKLRIKTRRNICSSGEITLVIGVRNLNEVDASGAVDLTSQGRINTGDFHFDLSGSTKITMELNAANVTTSGSGSTELHLKGQAASHNIDLSGSGDIQALDFVVGKYNIETSGASHCKINVLNTLSVHTSGASDIQYRGNPSNVSNDQSGASSITKID
ncbi:DUF2807 domain-containing protein [Inquilinus sp. KBS0705]|nr:DUF2807 domain-containing protein [Inquilinus sp. KBS0705]